MLFDGGDNMKRLDTIKDELCNIVKNCGIAEFERFLYDLRNTEVFCDCIIGVLEEFDMEHFRGVSDYEMSEMMSSGEYSKKFVEWLKEDT